MNSYAKTNRSSSSDPVLPWPYDTYRQLYEDWHLIQKTAGMPEDEHYVPKNCRSTCASELIANQVPAVVVKDFLGHATVAATENYDINNEQSCERRLKLEKSKLGQPSHEQPSL